MKMKKLLIYIIAITIMMNFTLFLTDVQSWIENVVVEPENPTIMDNITLKVKPLT